MEKHKELKNTLIDYTIVTDSDYIRTFDENHFTDFSFNKVSNIINDESKFVLIGLSKLTSIPFVLYNPKLDSIHDELYQNMIYTNKVAGYNKDRNRVLGYYEGDGILRFGNKYPSTIKIQFELATIEELIRKKYYISNLNTKTRHAIIQSYILSLGQSLGYAVKIAINDIKKIEKLTTDLLIARNPIPSELVAIKSNSSADRIDILWFKSNAPLITFEVEFSGKYEPAFRRFFELEQNLSKNNRLKNYNIICSGDEKLSSFINYCHRNISYLKNLFPKSNLYFLPLSKLEESLKLKDKMGFSNEIGHRSQFFLSPTSLIKILK
jgi:hypothetical protein